MKKDHFFKLILNSIIISTSLGSFYFPAFAADTVNSPSLKCETSYLTTKDDNKFYCDTNYQDTTLINEINAMPILLQDKKIFFIAKDAAKNKELTKQFIWDGRTSLNTQPYNIPYYSDKIYLDFYEQNTNDPDFTIREENYIGKAKLNSVKDLVYRRGEETALTTLDENGNVVLENEHFFFSRVTPNYYSIYIGPNSTLTHAEIILPENKTNLLTDEEKIVSKTYYYPPAIPTETEQPNAVRQQGYYYNFKIPKGVTEFKVLIYDTYVKDTFKYQFNIKLNKN